LGGSLGWVGGVGTSGVGVLGWLVQAWVTTGQSGPLGAGHSTAGQCGDEG